MWYETGYKFTVDQSNIRAISIQFSFNKLIPLTKTAFFYAEFIFPMYF